MVHQAIQEDGHLIVEGLNVVEFQQGLAVVIENRPLGNFSDTEGIRWLRCLQNGIGSYSCRCVDIENSWYAVGICWGNGVCAGKAGQKNPRKQSHVHRRHSGNQADNDAFTRQKTQRWTMKDGIARKVCFCISEDGSVVMVFRDWRSPVA